MSDGLTLEQVATWLRSAYNNAMSVYVYEQSQFVRLTNGSAKYAVDVRIIDSSTIEIAGERYNERFRTTCNGTKNDLIETLRSHI
jgi:hypothetical protein